MAFETIAENKVIYEYIIIADNAQYAGTVAVDDADTLEEYLQDKYGDYEAQSIICLDKFVDVVNKI